MDQEISDEIPFYNSSKLYNSPLELGIRCLLILHFWSDETDIEGLMILDHLSLNTEDIGGPISLHAPIPNRGVQVYARKDILSKGMVILLSKQLIDVHPMNTGICYKINKSGEKFLEYFKSQYFDELRVRVKWVVEKFKRYAHPELVKYVNENLQKWGGEFLTNSNN